MKKMMSLSLSDKEMRVLEELSEKKGLNKTMILKQALALYQIIHAKVELGEKIFVEDNNKIKSEIVLL
jgi:hypothetical protein